MNCAEVRQLLNEYVEKSLNDNDSRSLLEHLQECRQCAMEERVLHTLVMTLRSLPQKSAPAYFTDQVMEKLSQPDDMPATIDTEEAGFLSRLASVSGLKSMWIGAKMTSRSVGFVKYMPRPTVKLRVGDNRAQSLTKLPLALGFRW